MLVVMDNGYALKPGEVPPGPPPSSGNPPPAQPNRPSIQSMTANFDAVMIHETIPTVDATYRTIKDRDHRAMAGLSMGGMQTLYVTLNHLDQFSYIGGFSGAGGMLGAAFDPKTSYHGALSDPDAFNKKVHLVWLGIGTTEPERIHSSVQAFHEALQRAGIKHVYYESPGTAHDWLTWCRDLKQFAPLLFRQIVDFRFGLRSIPSDRTASNWQVSSVLVSSFVHTGLCGCLRGDYESWPK